jgi:hypothetical protein
MKPTEIIGKTFGYCTGNVIYIMVVLAFEPESEQYECGSYTGRQTVIPPDGESFTRDWDREREYFEEQVKSGEYELIRS